MKKKASKISKAPPPGWPTKNEWTAVEKKLRKAKPSKVLPPNAGPIDQVKHDLCRHFVKYCQETKLTQRELGLILGVSESRVSEIVHYHHRRFTIDKLLELLNIIKPNLKIRVA